MVSCTLALWLAALALSAGAPAASAQAGNSEVYRTAVGNISAWVLNDGPLAFSVRSDPSDPDALGLIANRSQADLDAALAEFHRPPGNITFYVNVLLLEVDGRRVLIDTGTGGLFPGTGRIFDNLAAAGVAPDSVDFIILSHGHLDHYGGVLAANGTLNFPNAAYFASRIDFDYWTTNGQDPAAEAAFRAIENRTTLVEADGATLIPGITAVFTPGHTPGHMSLEVDGGDGERLFCMGDAVHNELIMAHPGWEVAVDADVATAIETRRRLLARLASERTRVFVFHVPFPGLGHINAVPADTENGDEDSYIWVPELYLF